MDYIVEMLHPMGEVQARRMFGGAGVFLDGIMFALIADDRIYFKRDAINLWQFEEAGLPPFMYQAKGAEPKAMAYHEAPDGALDDQELLLHWAQIGFEAALRAASKKVKKAK
ncbi:MAG: TfoX/Sxy family protein [Sphingomonadales bacterium]